MPIYEFVCSECGEEFEDLVPMSDPSTVCPACGSTKANRLMPSNVGIAFKGSGFYVTDNNKHTTSGNGGSATKDSDDSKDSAESKGSEKQEKKDADDAKPSDSKSEKKADKKSSSKTAAA